MFDCTEQFVYFEVPAMSVDVYTTVGKKKVKKVDLQGRVVTDLRIIPKERPRFGKGVAYTSPNTANFESWIRKSFFKKYPNNQVVFYSGKPIQVHKMLLGCQRYREEESCKGYLDKKIKEFGACRLCGYRRKNLLLDLKVFLKDERMLDLDNVVKIVLDALNKVCFYDDNQFAEKHVSLFQYAEKEHLEVTINVIDTAFVGESLVGNYSIKRLAAEQTLEYLNNIKDHVTVRQNDAFCEYLLRCDKRKVIKDFVDNLKQNLEKLKKERDGYLWKKR